MLNYFKKEAAPSDDASKSGHHGRRPPLDSSDIRAEVIVLPDDETRQVDRPSLNRLPDFCDWEPGSKMINLLQELNQPICIHCRAREYGLCLAGLEQLGVVKPDARALAIGAGSEPPLFYYANKIQKWWPRISTTCRISMDNSGC
jgi:hypothetical protein